MAAEVILNSSPLAVRRWWGDEVAVTAATLDIERTGMSMACFSPSVHKINYFCNGRQRTCIHKCLSPIMAGREHASVLSMAIRRCRSSVAWCQRREIIPPPSFTYLSPLVLSAAHTSSILACYRARRQDWRNLSFPSLATNAATSTSSDGCRGNAGILALSPPVIMRKGDIGSANAGYKECFCFYSAFLLRRAKADYNKLKHSKSNYRIKKQYNRIQLKHRK